MKFRRRSAAADEADEATPADESTEQEGEETDEETAGGPFDVDDLPDDDVEPGRSGIPADRARAGP